MEVISRREVYSLIWLAKETKTDGQMLGKILRRVRFGKRVYTAVKIPKSGGGIRELSVPYPSLSKIQAKINKVILSEFPKNPNVFGFSGGNIVDAIKPHLESKVMLSFDVVDAFDNVHEDDVLWSLIGNRICSSEGWRSEFLSYYVANVITEICTLDDRLPQGAPTSPRLFDLAFKRIDEKLSRLANNVKGVYTRYADNISFSLKDKTHFPPRLERAVLRTVGRKYQWHKRSVRRMDKGAIRMLGMNVFEGKISVPRDFKRRLRLAIHHVKYLLDHNMPFEASWSVLRGQVDFATLGTLPESLMENFIKLERRIRRINSGLEDDEVKPKVWQLELPLGLQSTSSQEKRIL